MKLLSLQLTNFKGVRSLTLDTRGGNVDLFGENATGKTTVYDAFLWLMFGKDSQNRKDFELKTLDASGQAIPNIDHEVEGVFEIDGKTLVLRKSYKEVYTKKRGEARPTFTGHSTDYYIDGVPVKQKEYEARIADIIDENIFKLLTSPTFFNEQLHWQERRKILLQICGDIDDAEVIASDRALAKLPDILNGRKLDDHRKVIAARRAEINKELAALPIRIDEATRSLPFVEGIDPSKVTEDIGKLKAVLSDKQGVLVQLQSGGEVARARNKLSIITAELQEIRNDFNAANESFVSDQRKALNSAEMRLGTLKSELSNKLLEIADNGRRMQLLGTTMAKLRDKWTTVNSMQFEIHQDTVCPTCNQALPQDQLAEARSKAEAEFNRDKAEKLAEISAEGKRLKAEVKDLEVANAGLQGNVDSMKAAVESLEQKVAGLKKEIEDSLGGGTVEDWPGYTEKLAEKAKVEAAIANAQQGVSDAMARARQEVAEVEADIASLEAAQAKVEQHNKGQRRIEELEAQEKLLAAEFEKLEGELYLTEQFIRAKVKLLEERINGRFKYARFKLFDVQVNGGLSEVCDTTYKGVPYSGGLNNAARINVGLDIINALSEHYGFTAPIFVDTREAVTRLIPTKAQVISLIVSEPDKKLRVVCEEAARQQREAV